MKTNSKEVARYGLIVALIIVAYYIDVLLSQGLPTRMAIASIIVTMTICQLFDFKTAIFTTTVFGASSFAFSFIHPVYTSPAFMNPLISIFPRVIIGIVSYWVFTMMLKVCSGNKTIFFRDILPRSIAALSGAVTNTVLVISMISLFNESDFMATIYKLIILFNIPLEFSSALIIVPIISYIVGKNISKYIQNTRR